MTISAAQKVAFDAVKAAGQRGRLALMECKDSRTGKPVYAVCAIHRTPGPRGEVGFEFVPVARLFDGDPYAELVPPPDPLDEARQNGRQH